MPKSLTEKYTKLKPRSNNWSVDSGTLNIPVHNSTKFENSVLYRTVKAWNATSTEIRLEETHTLKHILQALTTRRKYNPLYTIV